jgi:hypothetical protein
MVRKDLLDDLDRRILQELGKDARASNRELARRLGVSAPTVAQRIRRMEDVGLIRGYRVELALPREPPSPPAVLQCAECKSEIQGRARTRRLHGKSYAFCCPMCESRFEDRASKMRHGTTSFGISAALLGWIATFGMLGASCMGMGSCLGPGSAPPPITPCAVGTRVRGDGVDEHLLAAGMESLFRPTRWPRTISTPPRYCERPLSTNGRT